MLSAFDERKEWLEARGFGLGGTDTSAVVNLNPWKSPLDVFLGKMGRTERREPTEAMYWGNKLEPVILERYAEMTNTRVCPPAHVRELFPDRVAGNWNTQTLLRHPQLKFILGTPDGIAYEIGRGVEVKTSGFKGAEWGKPGTDEVPTHYRLQVAQYMAITELESWDVVALFAGNKLEVFTIQRDRDLEVKMLDAAVDFWTNHIEKEIPPPIDASESWQRHLAAIHAIGTQTFVDTSIDIENNAALLLETQKLIKEAEETERLCKNQLAALIGDNKGAKLMGGGKVQWIRPRPSTDTDWQSLARSLNPTPEQIAQFTSPVQRAAYVRLYGSKEQ